jgi:hypothetical protein
MRTKRTVSENRIVERISTPLAHLRILNPEIREDIVDSPDIVIKHDWGLLGIEVARLDYEKYCKWLANSPMTLPYSRAAEVTIDLKKQLQNVMKIKESKYDNYKKLHGLNECWLILHNNVFEFLETCESGYPDREWFERFARYELQELSCPFDRVLFNLEHPDRWFYLYEKRNYIRRTSVITSWPSIIWRESAIVSKAGVNIIDLSDVIPKKEFY